MRSPAVGFIFVTILLDALGIGLIIPVLPDVIRRFSQDASFVSHYYGYFISTYALMQFLASPVLGSLSDRFGRRPVILVSMIGAALDYLLMAFAPTLGILFIGRVISGLTGASQTVASSYMADISNDKNRSANFGMIGAAWGLGFILGPMMGGLVGSYGSHYPFVLAAGLNFLNFLFGFFVLPESLSLAHRRHLEFSKLNPFLSLQKTFKRVEILPLILVYALLFFAGQSHPSTWTLYTQFKFHWSAFDVGVSLAVVGVCIAIVQGGLTRKIIPKLGEERSLKLGIVFYIAGFALFAVATRAWMLYAFTAVFCMSGLAVPALQSIVSRAVAPEEQGELQGSLMSIGSLAAILGPVFFTALFAHFTNPQSSILFPGASYIAASIICVGALLLLRPKT